MWDEISKMNLEHKYRDKINRQGHSNKKKSYWAFGYETLQDFYELSKESCHFLARFSLIVYICAYIPYEMLKLRFIIT